MSRREKSFASTNHGIQCFFDVLVSRKITEEEGEKVEVAPTAHDPVEDKRNVFLWRNPEGRSEFGLAGLWAQPGDCLAINVSFRAWFTKD